MASACELSSTDDAWEVVEELLKCEKVSLALQWYQQRDLATTQHTSKSLLVSTKILLQVNFIQVFKFFGITCLNLKVIK